MRLAEFGDVHGVRDVVVGLLAGALGRILARVVGELAADHVQVVGVVAVGVGDAAVPAGHPVPFSTARCSPANSSGSMVFIVLTCTIEVDGVHVAGVRVDRRPLLDPHLEAVRPRGTG